MAEVKYLDKTGLTTVWSKVKGIVTPKADKVSGATNGHLAGLNASGNLTDSGLAASNVAQKDGSYSGMTVGAAEDLVSAESVASEFTSRITGGSTAVGKGGTALVDKIKGRTLVFNQQVPNGNFANGDVNWYFVNGGTHTVTNGVLSYSWTSAYTRQGIENLYCVITASHKYYIAGTIKNLADSRRRYYIGQAYPGIYADGYFEASERKRISNIVTATAASGSPGNYFSIFGTVNVENSVEATDIVCIDLTLMFGASNEPSTVAEFEALYPGPYYDYNPGTLISNSATAIETVGFNQWDEEWEGGIWNTSGQKDVSATSIRSKNKIPCFPNTAYYCKCGAQYSTGVIFRYFDAVGAYVGTTSVKNGIITTPSNVQLFAICSFSADGVTTYNNDICISLSDPSRNGTYEPYWRSELELGLGDIKVKSHNIWDEETETGTINHTTGAKETSSYAQIRSKNYIPCSPNATYYIKSPSGDSGYVYVHFYDSEHNFISGSERRNTTVIAPANASYILLSFNTNYGTTYANNICINISDPAFDSRYEPYGDGGVISITGGLKSAGTVYDEISGGKFVKRLGSIMDLSVVWTWSSYDSANQRYNATISDMKNSAAGAAKALIPITYYYFTYQGRIYIETTISDRTAFLASLAGIPLYYELAQPIEYELADALPTAMRNDPYGTERRLPEDTAAVVTAPFRADITYSTNIKEAVQSLPQNYINVNSMQDFLSALGAQMGGTWTMSPADGKFDFTFTPNPVEPTL